MITFKSKLGPINIPNSYSDLTIKDFEFLANLHDQVAVAKYLTGLNEMQLAMTDISPLRAHLKFLEKPVLETVEPAEAIKINGKAYMLPADVGDLSYAQKLYAFGLMATDEDKPKPDFIGVLCTYLQPMVLDKKFDPDEAEKIRPMLQDMDIDSVFGSVRFLIDQLKEIAEWENNNLSGNPSHEQIRAGIQMFNSLGDFNTIDELAQGKPWKYDEILEMDYNTIRMKLHKNAITIRYNKNYEKIMREKSEQENKSRKNRKV